jgi:hypothetical protein
MPIFDLIRQKSSTTGRVVVQLPLPIRKGFIGLARCTAWWGSIADCKDLLIDHLGIGEAGCYNDFTL